MANNTSGFRTCSFTAPFNPQEIKYGRVYYQTAFIMSAILMLPSASLNILLVKSMYSSLGLRKPSTLFLYSLSVSDLLLALVQLPVYIVKKIGELNYDFELFCAFGPYAYLFGFMFSGVSLFTVTALSIDRYLIIQKGVHYSEHVTKTRVVITVLAIWLASIVISSLQYIISRKIFFIIAGGIVTVCFFATIIFYCKMLWKLREMRLKTSELSESKDEIPSASRYRRITFTMLLLFIVFVFCYLPYFCVIIVINILGDSRKGIESTECVTTVVTYIRSSINPAILLCRTTEIRKAAKYTIQRLSPF